MDAREPALNKRELRSCMRALAAMPADSAPVAEGLHRWLAARPELRTVAVYAALPGEVDLSSLVSALPERRWLFPRIDGFSLHFHPVLDPSRELAAGSFGIREPLATLPEVPVTEIDAFLCPGLAFDDAGGRLGRGRGFYDRVLAQARPGAWKIGVGFPHQKVAETFSEAHDIRMDHVECGH